MASPTLPASFYRCCRALLFLSLALVLSVPRLAARESHIVPTTGYRACDVLSFAADGTGVGDWLPWPGMSWAVVR